jgi:hypothetical protein
MTPERVARYLTWGLSEVRISLDGVGEDQTIEKKSTAPGPSSVGENGGRIGGMCGRDLIDLAGRILGYVKVSSGVSRQLPCK